MRNKIFTLLLVACVISSAYGTTDWPARYICKNTIETDFTLGLWNVRRTQVGNCPATEVEVSITSGSELINSIAVSLVDPYNGYYDTRIQIQWKSGAVGKATIFVYYVEYAEFPYQGTIRCTGQTWFNEAHSLTFNKGLIENRGELTTPVTEFVSQDVQANPISIAMVYDISDARIKDLDLDQVRWFNGTAMQTKNLDNDPFWDEKTNLNYQVTTFGQHQIQTEVRSRCGDWHPGAFLIINVLPTCAVPPSGTPWPGGTPPQPVINLGTPPLAVYSDGSKKIEPNKTYALTKSGFTDFDFHYAWRADGGSDLQFTGDAFSVTAGVGSYSVTVVPKPGREPCPVPQPIRLLVLGNADGNDLVVDQDCPIVFPEDIPNIENISDPDNLVLKHFVVTAKSDESITVMPGITLDLGAELSLEVGGLETGPDQNITFTEQATYDEYGRMVGNSRSYFDSRGLPLQTQYKNFSDNVILANATVYDTYGRAAISTLPAPVRAYDGPETGTDPQGCPIDPNKQVKFLYKPDFVKASTSANYTFENFDIKTDLTSKETSPDPVDGSQEGTLGWYYSVNNGASTNPRMNEPLVATTQYPYARTLFHRDGSGEVKSATKPGDNFSAGSGNVGSVATEPAPASDVYLADYLAIRQTKLGLANAAIQGEFLRTISVDETEKKSITYSDKAGRAIISLYFGTQAIPVTKSYQFYDNAGRLKVSMSPNGVVQYETGAGFESVDKTAYFYNGKGLLSAIEETDGGRTEYVYRKDGKIRFSQNAKQRKAEDNGGVVSYSYTNYDRSGRPVESGEYVPGASGIAFKSMEMTAILENVTVEGGLSEASGQKRSRLNTLYDEPDPLLPGGRIQRFVQGTVSRKKKDNDITTWYSYDERGRVEWMVQDIAGFGTKTIDYRYGPTGQVQEVLYQKGVAAERFSHFYEYDADGRLFKAYTTTSELQYNKKGELLNASERKLQATYHYYLHGPLKRIELADKLQGIDYVYTADGALKSINSADPNAGTDPGKDGVGTSAFRKDVFGMTLDYFNQDYTSAGNTLPNVPLPATYPEQHGGLIRAMRWHSPIETGKQFAYGYTYDNRDQFKTASWGTVTANVFAANPLSAYNESISGYDPNGNIDELNRKNSIGADIANFDYKYFANTNKLDRIEDLNDHSVIRDYDYNAIGELTTETVGGKQKHIEYDVTGKVTKVFSDALKSKLVTTFAYDDRGFRLNKTTYNEESSAVSRTWYVRDASGTVMATYEDDLSQPEPAEITELPVYASGRVGLFKPKFNYTQYELTDHLGNVRAVIGKPMEAEYLATMESERLSKESSEQQGDFDNVDNDITATDFNHTPPSVTVNGVVETVSEPNEVNRLNTMPISGQPTSPIGTGIMLWVHPGDVIDAEVFVKYANFNAADNNIVESLAGFLTTAFGASPVVDAPSLFSVVDEPGFASLPAWSKLNEDQPRAFLNYLLFDNDFKLQAFDFDQVSSEAEIQGVPRPHERLALEDITIKKEGYLYIYVSNQSAQNMEVYFDDLRVKHTYSDIEAGADFYPFGLTIEDRQIRRESYRHGYQGKFAEKDEETGWNHFELREYDPVVGRWTAKDPKGQFYSPYVGMGNNPAFGVDPDGGWLFGLFGSSSHQRRAARDIRDIWGGEINDYFSKDISVTYQGAFLEINPGYSTGGPLFNTVVTSTTLHFYSWGGLDMSALSTANDLLNTGSDAADMAIGLTLGGIDNLVGAAKVGVPFATSLTAYKWLSRVGAVSSFLGAATTVGSFYFDYRAWSLTKMDPKRISTFRFAWRTGGNLASIAASIGAGMYFGSGFGPLGTAIGGAVGGGFWAAEQSYDGVVWYGSQLSKGAVNFQRNGGAWLRNR